MHVGVAMTVVVIVPLVRFGRFRRCGVIVFRFAFRMLVAFLALFAVVMGFEGTAFAELQLLDARGLAEFHHLCVTGKRIERLVEEGFEPGADPEDHLRRLQGRGVGGFHVVGVRGGRALDDQRWLADTLHDRGDEGVDRLDRDHHIGAGSECRRGEEHGGGKEQGGCRFHRVLRA